MTPEQHLEWAKQRALEYVERGQLYQAYSSMVSDLQKNDTTMELLHTDVMRDGLMRVTLRPGDEAHRQRELRSWIEEFTLTSAKVYVGSVLVSGHRVSVLEGQETRALNPRFDLVNHSPDGFAWGYLGSGPSQLAVAMLADALGDGRKAVELSMDFKSQRIGRLDIDQPFRMTIESVLAWVHLHEGGGEP